jgi:hypothetical protein
MPDSYYYGSHTGQQIDSAVDCVQAAQDASTGGQIPAADAFVPAVDDNGSPTYYEVTDADFGSPDMYPSNTLPTRGLVRQKYSENRANARKACTGVYISNVSSLPVTHTQLVTSGATLITADYWCVSMRLTNPAAQMGDWTVTTGDRTVTVDGVINGETDIILFLADPYWA